LGCPERPHIADCDLTDLHSLGLVPQHPPFLLGNGLYANTDPVVLILAVALTVTVMMLRDEILTLFSMFAWTVWLGLVLVYFLGNHTLFSFYVTDFSPVLDVFVVPASFKVVNEVLGRIPIVISWKLRKP